MYPLSKHLLSTSSIHLVPFLIPLGTPHIPGIILGGQRKTVEKIWWARLNPALYLSYCAFCSPVRALGGQRTGKGMVPGMPQKVYVKASSQPSLLFSGSKVRQGGTSSTTSSPSQRRLVTMPWGRDLSKHSHEFFSPHPKWVIIIIIIMILMK